MGKIWAISGMKLRLNPGILPIWVMGFMTHSTYNLMKSIDKKGGGRPQTSIGKIAHGPGSTPPG